MHLKIAICLPESCLLITGPIMAGIMPDLLNVGTVLGTLQNNMAIGIGHLLDLGVWGAGFLEKMCSQMSVYSTTYLQHIQLYNNVSIITVLYITLCVVLFSSVKQHY